MQRIARVKKGRGQKTFLRNICGESHHVVFGGQLEVHRRTGMHSVQGS